MRVDVTHGVTVVRVLRRSTWRLVGTFILLAAIGCVGSTEVSATLPWDTTLPPLDAPALPGRPSHYKGLALALTDNGAPAVQPVRGIVGVVCVGMSNAAEECEAFRAAVEGRWATERHAAVRVVNCAVGSHAIERWIDTSFDATLWDACKTQRLPAAGVAEDQVLVLYHKAANQFTTAGGTVLPPYPHPDGDFERLRRNLSTFADRVPREFPSVRAVYTTSRSYGGFSPTPARGEPLSYEEGHALNLWLAEHPMVDGVWYGWGPYIWAPECHTGITNGSRVCYVREDYVTDGVHPSPTGEEKVARMLHARLLREAWYRP